MIYFLDNSLQLQKIVTSKNINSAVHEHELNGLIRGDIELDLSYANSFLILGIDHVGYYYKDEFYLHKIQRVEYDHVNESVKVVFRHIFFEDMLFGPIIKDVRPKNQDAVTILRQTIEANTRWQIVMTDVAGTLSTNFYWQVPYEVIEFVNKNFRVDMFPKILFDGKNINGFQLHVKNASSSEVKQRIPFGSRVLDLKYEEDFSEIVTKLVGHGKGEEVGDGYGRRINFSEINFNRNGVKSPVGSVYMEDPSVTNTYGNDGQTPREGRVVFEDIETPSELAEATYQHYLDVSRPHMLFTADVADIGDVNIGDSVLIVRREYDVYFKARIHKLSVNLLNPGDAQVELGDYEHFKESKVERKSREKNNRVQKQLSDRITRLKREANDFIDGEFSQAIAEFEQNYIDQKAQIEADLENMTNFIEGKSTEFTDKLNAEITQTKEYAEQQAQEKAEAVRTDLGTVTNGHQQMLDNLKSNVVNIDEFLGDSRSITLDERFQSITQTFEERINNIDSSIYNVLRDTRFQEGFWRTFSGSAINTDEDINYARFDLTTNNQPNIRTSESISFEKDRLYRIVIEYRTDAVPELDYMYLFPSSGGDIDINAVADGDGFRNLNTDGQWNKRILTFKPNKSLDAVLAIGSRGSTGDGTTGIIDVRLPYLTTSSNENWVYHPLDANQNISEVTRRITNLEDGYSELVTRSDFDFKTGKLDQYIKSVEETVEGSQTILQRVEDWQATNGQSVLETVDAYERKIWLNDFSKIGANLIPQSSNAWEDGTFWVGTGDYADNDTRLRTKEYIEIVPGEQYTFSDDSAYVSSIEDIRLFEYMDGEYTGVYFIIPRGGTRTYTATGNQMKVALHPISGFGIPARFLENPDGRIKLKLEKGAAATPMLNAISRIEQIADKINMSVLELDGTYLKQTDFELNADYWQLGAMRIGAEDVSSVLRGSPDAIDAVVSEFNLTGNLNAKGQITSLAVDAIEGNFARLFANELTANVITSDHIQVGTALVDKMFATSARIDRLITKTHFVNEMHALTLNVVDLNASHIRSRLLTVDTIEASWIKSGTALLDRVFSSTAMFERMMAKSGFVTTLNTVTIDTDLLTVRRRDGVAWIRNGMARGHVPVQIYDSYADEEVGFTGLNFYTQSSHWKTFKYFYTPHEGTRLRVVWACSLFDGPSNVEYMNVRVRTFSEYSPINMGSGVSERRVTIQKGETTYVTQDIPMPPPTYDQTAAYLEFRRAPDGQSINNRVSARILFIGQFE